MLYVTVHPDAVSSAALAEVDVVAALGGSPRATLARFARATNRTLPGPPSRFSTGVRPSHGYRARRNPRSYSRSSRDSDRTRHRRKYAEGELPPDRSFYFRGPGDRLNLRAQNLLLFAQLADGVDDETWLHHLRLGHYSRWIRDCIKDRQLADEVRAIEGRRKLRPQVADGSYVRRSTGDTRRRPAHPDRGAGVPWSFVHWGSVVWRFLPYPCVTRPGSLPRAARHVSRSHVRRRGTGVPSGGCPQARRSDAKRGRGQVRRPKGPTSPRPARACSASGSTRRAPAPPRAHVVQEGRLLRPPAVGVDRHGRQDRRHPERRHRARTSAWPRELERLSRVVGKEGKIAQRAIAGRGSTASGGLRSSAVNALIDDLVQPTSEMARVIGAVAKGDLSQTMALELDGRAAPGRVPAHRQDRQPDGGPAALVRLRGDARGARGRHRGQARRPGRRSRASPAPGRTSPTASTRWRAT